MLYKRLFFETLINVPKHLDKEGNIVIRVNHKQVQKQGDKPDFDFMQNSIGTTAEEQIYGLGLQYSMTNFKGQFVNMVSSEGGVGRGLQPLTDLLNTEKKARQGGSPLTTYAPAYSFVTSNRRGFVWPDHTEIGSIDFWSNPNWFNVNMWKTNQMTFNVIQGANLKKVVSGLTNIIGRMRALPRWT
jgi:alpha-glucosidase (family GH31 glycosyl hydrolase)